MDLESYYGDMLPKLKHTEQCLLDIIKQYPAHKTVESIQPIQYCKSRIKNPDSMIEKLSKRGLPTDCQTALDKLNDAIGVRVVCSFIDDVYEISAWLHQREEFEVIEVKDYIAYPKPNGYRSLHLILRFSQDIDNEITAEIQLRTIAIDFWAALEHQLKYKRHVEHEKIIRDELKRCADEIASVDISMQTIRDILFEDAWE